MKKNTIIVLIISLLFLISGNKIFAYTNPIVVNFEAYYDKNDNDYPAKFRNAVAAYKESKDAFNDAWNAGRVNSDGWAYNNGTNNNLFGISYDYQSYNTVGYTFHDRPISTYQSASEPSSIFHFPNNIDGITFSYAIYNMQSVNEPVQAVPHTTGFVKVTGNNTGVKKTSVPMASSYNTPGSTPNVKAYRMHISSSGVYYTDKAISSAAISQIQDNFPGEKELFFSAITRTTNSGATGSYDSDSAWEFTNHFISRWYNNTTYPGLSFYDSPSVGYKIGNGNAADGILSILNNYDNKILLPIDPQRKIIVNHCAIGDGFTANTSWMSGTANIKSNVFANSSLNPNSILKKENYPNFDIYYANVDGVDRWTQNNKSGASYSELYELPTRFGINIEKTKNFKYTYGGVEYNIVYAGMNYDTVNEENSGKPVSLYNDFVSTYGKNPSSIIGPQDGIYRIQPSEDARPIYVNMYYKLERDQRKNIYVRHIDKDTGALIPGTSNNKLKTTDNTEVYNENTAVTHSEKYTIEKNQSLVIETTKLSQLNGKTIEYKGMKYKGELTYIELPINGAPPYQTYATTYATPIDDNNEVFVNIYYSLSSPPPPQPKIPDVQLVGKLLFRNTSSEYNSATNGESLDYIPPTKTLTSHINNAYPYYVKGANYSRITTYYPSVRPSVNITGSYSGTYYYEVEVCSGDPQTCTTEIRSKNISGNVTTKSYQYTVPYTYTYYRLNNYRMYMIDNAELFDNSTNIGGQLFTDSLTSTSPNRFINTSPSYASRFKSGLTNYRGYKVYWNGSEVTSTPSKNVNVTGICIDESCSNLKQAAQDEVNSKVANNGYLAAKENDYRIMFYNTNDYLTLEEQDQFNYNKTNATLTGITNSRSYVLNPMIKSSYVELSNVKECVLDSTENDNKESYMSNLRDNYMNLSASSAINKTTTNDFSDKTLTVPWDRTNGMRELKGKINYKLIESGGYAVGGSDFDENITSNKYRIETSTAIEKTKSKTYDNAVTAGEVNKVNVLSPIQLQDPEIVTALKVNHSDRERSDILQKDAEFSFTPKTTTFTYNGYSNVNTNEFVEGYYVMFDFDLVNVRVWSGSGGTGSSSLYNGNGTVSANVPIYINSRNGSITAKTTDEYGAGSVSQITNTIRTVAVARNATDLLQTTMFNNINNTTILPNKSIDYMDLNNIKSNTSTTSRQGNLLGRTDIVADSYHAVYRDYKTLNIGRIYDFKITDCNDLEFKSVFRKTTSNNVNELNTDVNGNYYNFFSGTRKWIFMQNEYNHLENRTTEVGISPKRIIPLGPYKDPVNLNHITAPKLGYRISFDLKTTGMLEDENARVITIKPSYYYIPKDIAGKQPEFSKTDYPSDANTLDVYYKNSSGRYIKFVNSGYTIQFKPKDGYRNVSNLVNTGDDTYLSTKLQTLNISSSSGFVLKKNMLTTSNDKFLQGWYGEFKLPNSAILVRNGDINNPLKDGYIGVKFDISCTTTGNGTSVTLNYNKNDTGTGAAVPNTSQWDYEGFMGYTQSGETLSTPLKVQLERGIWSIDTNEMYNKIKGTVVLFDLDSRASDDFQ